MSVDKICHFCIAASWLFTKMSNDFFRLLVSQVDSIVVTVDIHTKRKEGKNGKSMCHL